MNCDRARQQITDSLAARALALPADVAAHWNSCVACQDFYQSQQKLFCSLDAGLRTTANAPVPPWLIPAVHLRIQDTVPRRAWIHTWLPAGAAAVALLCAVAVPMLHRAERRTASAHARSSDYPGNVPLPAGEIQAAVRSNPPAAPRVAPVVRVRRVGPRVRPTSADMEVMVDKGEARGLDHLVDSIRQKPALGRGFFQAAALPPDEMKPVPLIEIAELRVAPLAEAQ
jgi:hypothetical protein